MSQKKQKKSSNSAKFSSQNKILICDKVQIGKQDPVSSRLVSDFGITVDSSGQLILNQYKKTLHPGPNLKNDFDVIHNMMVPGIMVNSRGLLVCANREFSDLCGYGTEELVSTFVSDLFPMSTDSGIDLSSVWKSRIQHWEGFLELRCKDGESYQVRVVARPYCRSKHYWLVTASPEKPVPQTISCTLHPGNALKQISSLPEKRFLEFGNTLEALYDFCRYECISVEGYCELTVRSIMSMLKCDLAISASITNRRVSHISLIDKKGKTFGVDRAELLCEYVFEKKRTCRISGDLKQFFECIGLFSSEYNGMVGIPVIGKNGRIRAVVIAADRSSNITGEKSYKTLELLAHILTFKLDSCSGMHEVSKESDNLILAQITSGLAHEVRNPLNGIVSLAEALKIDLGDNAEYEEYFQHIRNQTERLSALTKELLELGSSIKTEQLQPVSLVDLCQEALEVWANAKQHQDRTVQFTAPLDESSAVVLAHKESFITAVNHLLNNAAQHSDPNTSVVFDIAEPGESNIVLRIIDRGRGLLPEGIERIFDPFFTTEKGHYGLGLSIVKRVVLAHGGSITIKNNQSGGCTVGVKIPLFL